MPAPLRRRLYTAALWVAVPFALINLARRGLRSAGYWARWGERFGGAGQARDCPVWIHAVSVGEVQAAVPLVGKLLEGRPGLRLLVTTTTPTGSARVAEALGDAVLHAYVPYDLPFAVRRFLDRAQPRLAVFMETELWPNTFALCTARGTAVVVANARLSARSARGYRRVSGIVRPMLEAVSLIAAQTDADAERFIELGAPPARVRVSGSVKFDLRVPASLREQAEVLRRQWGTDRGVWVAASTHEGEEDRVLDAFRQVLPALPDSLLVLVPRHPERFARVLALARKRGLRVTQRSQAPEDCSRVQVFLGDTMGELPLFYAAGDVAFVGGSLVPTGGHNLLEPASLGLPVLTGPHVFNFLEVARLLLERGAARQVRDAVGLAASVREILQDAELRHTMGERGREVVDENRGALECLLALLEPYVVRATETTEPTETIKS
jgi:3-deoxy-D-manno-octulosonic-acid transferase